MGKLERKICSDITLYLDWLDIDKYEVYGGRAKMACPIHGGDNRGAFVIFLDGKFTCGNFKCFTRGCSLKRNDVINLAAHLKEKDYKTVYHELAKLYTGVKPLENTVSKRENKKQTNINTYFDNVQIPSYYYLNRGFSKDVLKSFGVGFCSIPKSNMYMRSTVPVFDKDKKEIIGVVGRSVFEECNKCGGHHNPKYDCPDGFRVKIYSKWKNSPGFYSGEALYNSWNLDKDYAYIVEGQSDVWRAYEAGFTNTAGIFGMCLKEGQHKLLKKLGINKLIFIIDNDEAGEEGKKIFLEKYAGEYDEYQFLNPQGHDLSDMTIEQVRNLLI